MQLKIARSQGVVFAEVDFDLLLLLEFKPTGRLYDLHELVGDEDFLGQVFVFRLNRRGSFHLQKFYRMLIKF